jgi:hypothetical protein
MLQEAAEEALLLEDVEPPELCDATFGQQERKADLLDGRALEAHEETVGGGCQLGQDAGILHTHRLLSLGRDQGQRRQNVPGRTSCQPDESGQSRVGFTECLILGFIIGAGDAHPTAEILTAGDTKTPSFMPSRFSA